MGGVAFAIAGLWLGYRALGARRAGAATAWLAAASFSLGLAGGTRLSLIPTIAALAALAGFARLWQLRQRGDGDGSRARLGAVAAALLPAGAIGIGLLVCNYIRFGSWTEFGRSYVMTYPFFVPGFRFLPPDVYAYSIAPPRFTCWFPFLSSGWNTLRLSVPGWLPVAFPPDHHTAEPTVGLLTAAPFTVLALVALAVALGRARLRRLAGDAPRVGDAGQWMTRMNWLWAALILYVAGSAPFLILNVTTMRYEHDFASGVLLLAIFGGWRFLAAPSSARGRRAIGVDLRAARDVDDRRGRVARLRRVLQALRATQPGAAAQPGDDPQRLPLTPRCAARSRRSRPWKVGVRSRATSARASSRGDVAHQRRLHAERGAGDHVRRPIADHPRRRQVVTRVARERLGEQPRRRLPAGAGVLGAVVADVRAQDDAARRRSPRARRPRAPPAARRAWSCPSPPRAGCWRWRGRTRPASGRAARRHPREHGHLLPCAAGCPGAARPGCRRARSARRPGRGGSADRVAATVRSPPGPRAIRSRRSAAPPPVPPARRARSARETASPGPRWRPPGSRRRSPGATARDRP